MPNIKGAVPISKMIFGGHMVFADNLGFMGNVRVRASPKTDFGFNGTIYFTEKNPFIALQGDISFVTHKKTKDVPFNFAISPYFTTGFGDITYFSFGGNGFFDFPLTFEEGPNFLFYFGLGVGAEVLSYTYKVYVPYPPYTETRTKTESSLEGHMSLGAFVHLTRVLSLVFEFHFTDDPMGGGYFSGGIIFRQ